MIYFLKRVNKKHNINVNLHIIGQQEPWVSFLKKEVKKEEKTAQQ